MNRKSVILTIINLFICFTALSWTLSVEEDVLAQGQPQAFLGSIFYGTTAVTSVFDHDLPITDGNDGNNYVKHYDNQNYTAPYSDGLAYDQHEGIDYALSYDEVLAAVNGIVDEAGWAIADNHRMALGLRVILDHDNDYSTIYGHLSTITIRKNETVTVNPANLEGIIGISGNTGHVIGNNCDPDVDPLCGAHLHFEVRNGDNRRVNPYGWNPPSNEDDPWAIYRDENNNLAGATSYDLWTRKPAIIGTQFTSGTAEPAPSLNEARITIDNTHDFAAGPCWTLENNNDGYNDSYYWVAAGDGYSTCTARWKVPTDSFTPPGEYHIYGHAPASATAYHAYHRIYHNNTTNTALAVQAAYPNTSHDEWVYLGRREFAMDGSETILLKSDQGASNTGSRLVADAVRLVPAFDPAIAGTAYLSTNTNGTVSNGSLAYTDEDI
ncbi:MAG: peptidoglycan DD-metalloendopeptidase family protein [Chloroflexi bacterium]|nr:peptidoglycan DD-metalloendopeptidase family protein [Chloroflexota bacterium]